MCISFWYTPAASASPGASSDANLRPRTESSPYAFILLSNRDLELGRPALDATFHDFEKIDVQPYGKSKADVRPPSLASCASGGSPRIGATGRKIISGRDAADPVGGTWLGMAAYHPGKHSAYGRIGVLTNIHDDSPVPKGTKTRGALIKDWLKSRPAAGDEDNLSVEKQTREYLDGLKNETVRLAGFNLLLFDIAMGTTSKQDTTGGRAVRAVSALQLTNRYRPGPADHHESPSIPAEQASIDTGDTARILPTCSNPAYASTSPLGVFQAAITELKPSALHMGGMSNSLLEEPFQKVTDGVRELQRIVGTEFADVGGWDERREQGLLKELFALMSQSHPVSTFQDLERAICVPLCTIPLPGTTGNPYQPTAMCEEDEAAQSGNSMYSTRPHGARKTKIPGSSRIIVNHHTMLSTPVVTPEGSPIKPGFKALPSCQGVETTEEGISSSFPKVNLTGSPDRQSNKLGSDDDTSHAVPAPINGQKPYGTRLTTIILVKWTGEVTYVERDVWWMDDMGCVHKGGTEDRVHRFSL